MEDYVGFPSYEKIPNRFKKRDGSAAILADKATWVVTEKVHGANFSFLYCDGNMRFAKRKGYLNMDDIFFGFQVLVQKMHDQMSKLFEDLQASVQPELPSSEKMYIVYGELFGGSFPSHPDVKRVEDVIAVQKGVFYAPDIHFMAFDIALECEGHKRYLDYADAMAYFERHGLLYAKPLSVGTLSQALSFDTRQNSTIPKQLGLPHLEDNMMEGVVVKPYKDNHFFEKRPVLKMKNEDFCEFNEAAAKTQTSANQQSHESIAESMYNLVNFNRLESAISKIGPLECHVDEIKEEMWLDVLNDYKGMQAYDRLSKQHRRRVGRLVRKAIQKEIDLAMAADRRASS